MYENPILQYPGALFGRSAGFEGYPLQSLPYFESLYGQFRKQFDKAQLGEEIDACGLVQTDSKGNFELAFYIPAIKERAIPLKFLDVKRAIHLRNRYIRATGIKKCETISGKLEYCLEVESIIPEKLTFSSLPLPRHLTSLENILSELQLRTASAKRAEFYAKSIIYSMAGSRGWSSTTGGVGIIYAWAPDDKRGAISAFDKFSSVISNYWFPKNSINGKTPEYGKTILYNPKAAPHDFSSLMKYRSNEAGLESLSWDMSVGRLDKVSKPRLDEILTGLSNYSTSDLPLLLEYLDLPIFPEKSNELFHYLLYAKEIVQPNVTSATENYAKECDLRLSREFGKFRILGIRKFETLRLAEAIAKASLSIEIERKHVSEAYESIFNANKEFYEEISSKLTPIELLREKANIPEYLELPFYLCYEYRGRTKEELCARAKELLGLEEDEFMRFFSEMEKRGLIYMKTYGHWSPAL